MLTPRPNLKVKAALTLLGKPLYASFAEIGIPQVKGSKILSGVTIPTAAEKKAISDLVGLPEDELFSNPELAEAV